ncbi:FHA domain-containing protein (plasmid) [Mycobacterium avium subsp. hominissuis]|uniref:FHA domain-containing protein n=1 Tax=Mycobacterium avium TaxID=1764 RepID=UPI0031405C92
MIDSPASPPDLTIDCAGSAPLTVQAQDAPITIGRELPAHIRIPDPRVSRTHLHIEVTEAGWTVTDARSRNGTYRDGHPIDRLAITDGLTVCIGNPDGIPVAFTLTPTARPKSHPRTADVDVDDDDFTDDTASLQALDPGIAAAGAEVVKRREELGFSQRKLKDDGVIGQSNLVAFERGRRWPRDSTRAKLEKALGWEPGHLARVRYAAGDPDETTDAMSDTVRVTVLVQALELALDGIKARIGKLPSDADAAFADQAEQLLGELRRVQDTATDTVRTTRSPGMARLLGDVRRTYNQLVMRAAQVPGASLSYRLYAARHRAELSVDETAAAAGVDVSHVTAVEAGHRVPEDVIESLDALASQLLDA